jgi:glucose-6-phosphate 1-dehydrogenase
VIPLFRCVAVDPSPPGVDNDPAGVTRLKDGTPATSTSLVELKPPPQRLLADSAPARSSSAASGSSTWSKNFREREAPYERLLGDAMAGGGALFTREDAVEAAWAVVDPVLKTHHPACPYNRHSWGPKEADALIAIDGGWHNPGPAETIS